MNAGLDGFPSSPTSEIWLGTFVGYGSLHTAIPYYSVIHRQIGTAMSLVNSAIYGAGVIIGEPGLYSVESNYTFSGADNAGISVNATSVQAATAITTIAQPTKLDATSTPGGNLTSKSSFVGNFKPGDIVRPHTNIGTAAVTDRWYFRVARLATP